ncbi:hypothetical protein [Tsuneonella sp. HG222]
MMGIVAMAATPVPALSQEAANDPPAFDRQAWLDDYARLKETMARGYANLD